MSLLEAERAIETQASRLGISPREVRLLAAGQTLVAAELDVRLKRHREQQNA